ncbi:MAG: hypothetical protein ACOX6X_01365 [Dethiobacteria bacterium]
MFVKRKVSTTSKVLIGVGGLTAGIGKFVGGRFGNILTGFGLAHIFLGTLNKFLSPEKGR